MDKERLLKIEEWKKIAESMANNRRRIYPKGLSYAQKKNLRFRKDFKLSEAACQYLEMQYIFTIDDYCKQVYAPICGGMMEDFYDHWDEEKEIENAIEENELSEFVNMLKQHYAKDTLTNEEILQMPIGYMYLQCNMQLYLLEKHVRTIGDCLSMEDADWFGMMIAGDKLKNLKEELARVCPWHCS